MVTHSGSSPWHKEPRTQSGTDAISDWRRLAVCSGVPSSRHSHPNTHAMLPAHASVKELATCFLQKGHAKLRRSVAYQPRTIGAGLASACSVGSGLIRLSVISACRSHHHAATSLDGLTCQPARLVAHEECHYVSNISRLPQSPEWRHLCGGLAK